MHLSIYYTVFLIIIAHFEIKGCIPNCKVSVKNTAIEMK